MLAMWGIALAIVIVQRDLGAALLFFLVFLALLYVATRRPRTSSSGWSCSCSAASCFTTSFRHVRERIDIWIDPFADPLGAGYQIIRALYAFGRGGILGTGLGAGLPQVGSVPCNPGDPHRLRLRRHWPRSWACSARWPCCGVYLVIAERGLRIAATAADDFRALLATGLTLVIVVQAAIIAGGNLRVVPLTGITLPLVSYGGSSLLVNGAVIGLLLALTDRCGRSRHRYRRRRLDFLRRGRPETAEAGRASVSAPRCDRPKSSGRHGRAAHRRQPAAPVASRLPPATASLAWASAIGRWCRRRASLSDPRNPLVLAAGQRAAPRGTIFDGQRRGPGQTTAAVARTHPRVPVSRGRAGGGLQEPDLRYGRARDAPTTSS